MAMGDEICCLHLIDLCIADVLCDKVHSSTPYLWQSWSHNQWIPLTNNEEVERDYCNPAKTKHVRMPPLYFDTMTCGSDKVQRLSVNASAPDSLTSLITKWVWFWEESEDKWREFRPMAHKKSPSITSEELERRYLNGENLVTFTAGSRQYELRFSDMLQTNIHTSTQRLVRRRPVFISKGDIQKACEIYRSKAPPITPMFLPDYWDPRLLHRDGYERIILDTTSSEYAEIFNIFDRTMSGCDILSIERIQNLPLWKFFNLQADQISKKNSGNTNEQILFHGINSNEIDDVCKHSLDWRICGTHGSTYGKGSYFARDALLVLVLCTMTS
ncbi:protein mono-ADP-ribosyltransferase PARP12-like [Sardina pilchardus]|uniref:protein mono-ADP-ribosyltransferase PARP12-like n=1 Tax=Sardina pilchardus TaxID=27697 RepID=UPI002E0DADC1